MSLIEKQIASFDINHWYRYYDGICPNCGTDMKTFHPEQNIANHFSGECVNQGWGQEKHG